MCSAAATHFTHDLIKAISSKYRHQTTSSKYPPWKDAIQIWTPKVLLPHVYFVLSCNPNLGVWEMIKKTTAFIFKTYHHWSVEEGTISDKEKLARFILWHTEVIYHIVQLGPKIKSSQDNVMGSTRDIELMAPKVSTLARMFHMLHIDFDSFTANSRGGHILERHVSETFERDYKLGYPTNKDNWTMYPSVWERWIAKSDEIRSTAEDVHWPENLDPQRSKLEPILLFNGEIENDMKIKKDPQVSEFVQHYKNELMKTMRFIKNSQSENPGFPPYTLNQFSRGIHIFLKKN
ncbi:hypothetical protein DFH28DRAFT_1077793 [Melampsora americana]|nr:hypothetical protein DFH28DRAFT_1077793 [Melampsora americana]